MPIIADSCTLFFYACGDYTWSLRKTIRLIVKFLQSRNKYCIVTYLDRKANSKEHKEEAL